MKFKTQCLVRTSNKEEKNKLNEWLEDIGYQTDYWLRTSDLPNIFTEDDWAEPCSDNRAQQFKADGWIDCGTDIELFKTLAAMNDEDDYGQWFSLGDCTGEGALFRCDYIAIEYHPNYDAYEMVGYGKATAEEIVEHFKGRQLDGSNR